MRSSLFVLLLACPLMAQDARSLIDKAKGLLRQPAGRPAAQALLEQAMAKDPYDIDAIMLLGIVRFADLQNNPAALRTQVQPLFEKALTIREQIQDPKPEDLATILELNGMLMTQ